MRAGAHTFAGPDNGLLRWAVEDAGPVQEAVRVEQPRYRLSRVSNTFHGRDVIAPRRGPPPPWGAPLPPSAHPRRPSPATPFPAPLPPGPRSAVRVLYVDRFGNAITNLPPLPGVVRVQGRELRRVRTATPRRPGEPVALEGSPGFLELAVDGGSAASDLGLTPGTTAILTTAILTLPPEP